MNRRSFFETLAGFVAGFFALWSAPKPTIEEGYDFSGLLELPPDPARWPGLEPSAYPGRLPRSFAYPIGDPPSYRDFDGRAVSIDHETGVVTFHDPAQRPAPRN